MAMPIIPRLVRSRLYFQVSDVLLPTFAQAATAWSAAALDCCGFEPSTKLEVGRG